MAKQPQVYVVSDSLGETAESVAKATIGQYDTDIEIHRVPFIRHTDQTVSYTHLTLPTILRV